MKLLRMSHGISHMGALELLRTVSFWNDSGIGAFTLEYVRNREKLEVDFLIVKDEKPFLLVEAKLSDTDASPSLKSDMIFPEGGKIGNWS